MNAQQQIIDVRLGFFPNDVHVFDPLEKYTPIPFTPKPYQPPKNVVEQHNFPRFGHTNNIASLASGLSGSSDTATSYIVGICGGAMLILAIALVWGMVIIGLQIAGQKKVGFMAGRLEHPDFAGASSSNKGGGTLPPIEEEPEDDESLLESEASSSAFIISNDIEVTQEQAKKENKFKRKVLIARVAFVLSGLGVIIASILFYAKGVASFHKSLTSAHGGLDLVQQIAYKTINMTDNAIYEKNALLGTLKTTKEDTGGRLCDGGAGPYAQEIQNGLAEFASEVEELSSMIDDNIGAFGNDLRELVTITEDVNDKLYSAEIFFGIAVAITVMINVLILAMLGQTYFSAKGVSNCCTKFITNAILWPVFSFFLVLAWIFATLFLVTSLAGSDFCVKPDVVVEGILRKHQDKFSSAIFQFIIYYISGCKVKPANSEVEAIADQIGLAVGTVHDVSEAMMGMSIPTLQGECGLDKAAATALEGGAELLHNGTHLLNKGWIEVRTLLECKTFNPVYTTLVHDAFCIDAVDGLTWLYSSAFAMFIFSMLMIMFRAGLYPVNHPSAKP